MLHQKPRSFFSITSLFPIIVIILVTSYLLFAYWTFLLGDGESGSSYIPAVNVESIKSSVSSLESKVMSEITGKIGKNKMQYMGLDSPADPNDFPPLDLGIPKKIEWKHGEIHLPGLAHLDKAAYPEFIPLMDRIIAWNPDDPDPPAVFHEKLQHFDYQNGHEREMARAYRDAEVPFKMYNVPEFEDTIEKWTDTYLKTQLDTKTFSHVEHSNNNHFMYWAMKGWKKRKELQDYVPPTKVVDNINFSQWLDIAYDADKRKFNRTENMQREHYYFMTSAPPGDRKKTFVARDLTTFSSGNENFFIPNPKANKGTQCRFGERGIISEAHYDCGRNMVLMLRGNKRYVLTPPASCDHVKLIPDPDHPSYRHSTVDWSNATQAKENNFDLVDSIDTIVRTGEVLFIPSYWMHYIISNELSIQCNSRFGPNFKKDAFKPIEKCFKRDMPNSEDIGFMKKHYPKHNPE